MPEHMKKVNQITTVQGDHYTAEELIKYVL